MLTNAAIGNGSHSKWSSWLQSPHNYWNAIPFTSRTTASEACRKGHSESLHPTCVSDQTCKVKKTLHGFRWSEWPRGCGGVFRDCERPAVRFQGPVSWRPTTVKWRDFTVQPSFHHCTRQTEYHEALTSSANDEVRCDCKFADDGNASWYSGRFVECRWWNDGRTVKTVVNWRSSASMIPTPGRVKQVTYTDTLAANLPKAMSSIASSNRTGWLGVECW